MMYLEYFGFRERPFNITPDPRFIFLSRNHREVFAHLLYGIRNRCGFIELTGEVGTGKTTVLRTLLGQLDPSECRIALILNPCLSSIELLRAVCREYGIDAAGKGAGEILDLLNTFLLDENRAGRTVVLVVDEAQNLAPDVLEQVRLLSNLETERDKLIQIVLAGQPELRELLARRELRQLAQRVTVRFHLPPMDESETAEYVLHRIRTAGSTGGVAFTPRALARVYGYARGVPRLINVLCDRALLVAYTKDTRRVDHRIISQAVSEVGREGLHRRRVSRIAAAVLFAAAVAVSVAAALYDSSSPGTAPPPRAQEAATPH